MNTQSIPARLLTAAAIAAAMLLPTIPLAAQAQVYVSFNVGAPPPMLPEYQQPMLTQPGQIWQPGYWAWGAQGYYWVPGTWVTPPSAGLYWTPGYWGYNNGSYAWNNGYWAPQVGYYGGINYGAGYFGSGYTGGYWNNGAFLYNTAYTNVNPTIVRTTYVRRIIVQRVVTRYAFNGPGGVRVRPTAQEIVIMHERHVPPTQVQIVHARVAAQDRNLYARYNGGHPRVVAVERPVRTENSLPHFTRVKMSTESMNHAAAVDRAQAAAARKEAQNARARAQAAHEHARDTGTRAASVQAHAATVHANEATLHAKTATEKAHDATVNAHHHATSAKPPSGNNDKRPPLQ